MMGWNEPTGEPLLGYLLEALEPSERRRLEANLAEDPSLRRDLKELNDSLEPLRLTREPPEPPAGLAERTCQLIAAFQAGVDAEPLRPVPPAAGPTAGFDHAGGKSPPTPIGAGLPASPLPRPSPGRFDL